MNAVTEANHVSKPVYSGFVWKQGGADGTRKDLADAYYDTFKQLVSDLREDLQAPDMPVFIQTYYSDEDLVGRTAKARHSKYIGTVLMAHNKAGRDLANTITIHHGRLPTNADGIHLSTEGQLRLGRMTAAAIAEWYEAQQQRPATWLT